MKLDGEQPYRQNDTRDVASKVDRPDGKLSTIDIFKVESLWEDFGEPIDGNTAGLIVEEKRFSIEKAAVETELSNMVVSLDNAIAVQNTCLSDSFSSGDKPKAAEEITGDICSGKISLKDLLSANDCASEPQKSSPISLNFSSSDRKRSFNGRTVEQDTVKEYYAVTSVASEAATLNQTSKIKESPTNGITKGSLEDHSVEASSYDDGVDIDDFNPRARETGGIDGSERTTKDSEQLNRAEKGPAVDGSKVDGATNSVRNSVHHYDGDTIMSGPIISSGPKASSGHIPYSGSISHRSDSSTTSTRSFAFPCTLQTEWNTSPVKMAKADRRRFRKHHGWRVGLFCCRF
uniref:Uncharacterized protein n=1 Tax=Ananas comosus var. bracteatus TaxID=296719 RepID=A0A6V7P3W1_ANACO|nr:unnamed protein product [Ananas comosus var. bracteatus]